MLAARQSPQRRPNLPLKLALSALGLLAIALCYLLCSPDTGAQSAGAAPLAASGETLPGRADLELPGDVAPAPSPSRAAPFQRPKGKVTRARVWSDDPVEPEPVTLALRVFDSGRRVVADAAVAVELQTRGRGAESFVLETNGLGEARTPEFTPSAMEGPVVVRVGALEAKEEGLVPIAEREFDRLHPGPNLLGDFQLLGPRERGMELLVSGRVVDEAGRGIEGVGVSWESGVWEQAGAKSAVWPDLELMRYGGSMTFEKQYGRVAGDSQGTRTDAAGRFEIWGEPGGRGGITLVETEPPHGLPMLALPDLPALGLVWRAEGRRRVTGRLLLPEGCDPQGLAVKAIVATAAGRGQARTTQPGEDGSFALWLSETGRAVIVDKEDWLWFESITLWSAAEDEGPEGDIDLGAIDLRDRIRSVNVLITDAEGEPLPGARLLAKPGHVRAMGASFCGIPAADDSGHVELVVPATWETVEFQILVNPQSQGMAMFTGGLGPYPVDEVPAVLVAE